MKKLLSCLLTFCLFFGLGIYNINNLTPVKASEINIKIADEPFEGEKFNHIFTQDELEGTEYEGQNVKVKDGIMYVENRSVVAAVVYLYTISGWIIVGYMANGTFQAVVDYGSDVYDAAQYAKEAWSRYQTMVKSVYANVSAKTSTVYLTNGNVCYRQNQNYYVCNYSLRPEEDSD